MKDCLASKTGSKVMMNRKQLTCIIERDNSNPSRGIKGVWRGDKKKKGREETNKISYSGFGILEIGKLKFSGLTNRFPSGEEGPRRTA